MTVWEILSAAATALALLSAGFTAGMAIERRQSRSADAASLLAQAVKAIQSVEMRALDAPTTAACGEDIVLVYRIHNDSSFPLDVWLGADAELVGGGRAYDTAQDKSVTVAPGTHDYQRYFNVDPELQSKSATLSAAVWLGVKSDPSRSLQLGCLTQTITVVAAAR